MPIVSHGLFWLPDEPDQQAAGQLTIPDIGSPELRLLDPMAWFVGAGPGPLPRNLDLIHGVVADHGKVTLINGFMASVAFNATYTQSVRVGLMLVGTHIDDPDVELLGGSPISLTATPVSTSAAIEFGLDDRALTWDADGVAITWKHEWDLDVDATEAHLLMRPRVTMVSAVPRSLEWWWDNWLVPTDLLLSILGGVRSNPAAIEAWPIAEPSMEERYGEKLRVFGKGIGSGGTESDVSQVVAYAASVDLNPGGLHDVLGRMVDLRNEQGVFLELLTGAIRYRDRPLRNRYLDLTAALEAYHAVRFGLGPVDESEFKKQRKSSLDAVKEAGIDGATVKFLKRWMPGRSHFTLEKKLKTLASAVALGADWSTDAAEMARIRNAIAHGSEGPATATLREVHDQALDVCRRLVLTELGVVEPPRAAA